MVQGKLENKKIGILGGSFDPAHVGHVRISKLAKKNYDLSQVIWAITKQNPFKKNNPNDLYKRTAYAKKINKNNKFIKVKCFEEIIKSNRTVDLIKYLKKKFKNSEIFFLMGADNLINFHKWKSYKELLKMSNLVVFSRKGFDTKAKKSVIMKHLKNENFKFFKNLKIDVSSTQLRNKIINGS